MKKFAIVVLTLILLLVIAACSSNDNMSKENQANQSEAVEAPVVMEAPIAEEAHPEEHAVEPVEETKPAAEPMVEVEPAVEAVETAAEAEPKPEVVEADKAEPDKVEVKEEPAVVEPAVPAVPVAEPKIHKVDIVNFAFSPESLKISVGDIVEFTNLDAAKHSAVEDNGVFDTGLLAKNESKQVTFNDAGEFGYYCGPHPDMRALIIVE